MFVEVAKPVTLILCILALYGVFYAAFLDPANLDPANDNDLEQRTCESLGLLALAGGVSFVSALFFREAAHSPRAGGMRLIATLPLQMFCWASGIMLVLFLVSWYLERYCKLYRDVRFF